MATETAIAMVTLNVYASPNSTIWKDVNRAVGDANGLQTQFRFVLAKLSEIDDRQEGDIHFEQLEAQLSSRADPIRGVIFCDRYFDNKILVNEVPPDRVYVSCAARRAKKSPPLRLNVLYELASASLALGIPLEQQINDDMIHDPPVGCLWDWWNTVEQRRTAMFIARICPDCQATIRQYGAEAADQCGASLQILSHIRRMMLGETPEIANRIFISYGHANDWSKLQEMLEGWGLQVEYFNRVPPAGIPIVEHWQKMLDSSRFAFAVMTPDETLQSGIKLARQNVIHEIGLCHARLGLQNTAILVTKDTERFTNVAGINHIEFESVHLARRAPEIRALLEARGIL